LGGLYWSSDSRPRKAVVVSEPTRLERDSVAR